MPKKTQKAHKGLKTAVMALFAKNSTLGIKIPIFCINSVFWQTNYFLGYADIYNNDIIKLQQAVKFYQKGIL